MSTTNVVARVYAQALFEIGNADGTLPSLVDELRAMRKVITELEPDVRAFIDMPQLPRGEKWQVIEAAFASQVSHNVLGLLHVLVDRRRESVLVDVVSEFEALVDEASDRVLASVITARALDDDLVAAIKAELQRQTGKEIVLDQKVDPQMIGGVRLSLGDLVVDGTTRRALHDMRRTLASSLA